MPKFQSVSYLLVIMTILFLSACTKTPDVRLTLCQDLTRLLLNSPQGLQWQESQSIIKGYEDLEMQLSFTLDESGSTSSASCFYAYEQDEIGAETFQDPEAAYSTYPAKMILQSKVVDKVLLSKSINQVMLQQGKNTVKKVQADLENAAKKAMDRIKE